MAGDDPTRESEPDPEPTPHDVQRLAERMFAARDLFHADRPGDLEPFARRMLRETVELRRTARWLLASRLADIDAAAAGQRDDAP